MATELAEKRQRFDEESNVRRISLSLDDFPSWVREASDDELIKALQIGVLVKDSVAMSVTFQDKNIVSAITDELTETLVEPMREVLEGMTMPLPMESENDPTRKGILGEEHVYEELKILKDSGYDVDYVTKTSRKGDFWVTNTATMGKYLIEVKNCKKTVGTQDVEKFERDVNSNTDLKVGILFSLHCGIAQRAAKRKFEIAYLNKQYRVYVPNVSSNEHLIVWSIFLADELASLDQDLAQPKIELALKLYEDFQKHVDGARKCKATIATLKRTVGDLEGDLLPLLKIIEDAKNKLCKVLH